MATQYEVEHNIKSAEGGSGGRRRRQVDMSTFTAHLNQISTEGSAAAPHHNPHATPNPVDHAALFRLLQDQFNSLASTAPTEENRDFLRQLFESLDADVLNPPTEVQGVRQEFLDSLERVPRKSLKKDETCPICAERYLDDHYCLVVELPCHHSHKFDLECVGPWLLSKGTCPMCRKDLTKKKEQKNAPAKDEDEAEEDDMDGLYA